MSARRFRVAFSFAGERREFVAATARLLAGRFGEDRVLYDAFHTGEFAQFDLGIRLPKLYSDQSDLIVVVLSPEYDAKLWTGWEWVHIHGLLNKSDGHRVMPCRFARAQVDGLSVGCGFVELDHLTPEAFATVILQRLARNENLPRDHYLPIPILAPEVASARIHHLLPALQPIFGRERQLARIREALDAASHSWGLLICGPAGMGKTALAVRAAHEAPADRFDRIIFVTLKSRVLDDGGFHPSGGFLTGGLSGLLNEIARAIERSDLLRSLADERPRLLVEALQGRRVLLVLDNLESLPRPELDTLLNFVRHLPGDCRAVLTARERFASGAEELILTPLDSDAALETLAELARGNPLLAKSSTQERLELHRVTSGQPLLLRWAAGQVGRGHCLTLGDALEYLRHCPAEHDPLEYVFGHLVDGLSPDETRVLCALTHFSLPAGIEHLAEIAGIGSPTGPHPVADSVGEQGLLDAALKGLAVRSLAVPGADYRTYTLIPLVAEFLRKKRPGLIAETANRLEARARELIIRNGFHQHDRFPVLEAAWPTLAAAIPRFVAGSNDLLQEVCRAFHHFPNFSGRWDEWLALCRDAENKAVGAGDFASAGWRAYDAGRCHDHRGQATEVLACALRAEQHWSRSKDAGIHEQAATLRLRGIGFQLNKDYAASISATRKALGLFRKLGRNTRDVAGCLNTLAGTQCLDGKFTDAQRNYRRALHISRLIDDREGVATCTGNLADLALDRGDWSTAERLARTSLSLSKDLGRLKLVGSDHGRLAKALARLGRTDEALPHALEAVAILERLRARDLAWAREVLAECAPAGAVPGPGAARANQAPTRSDFQAAP